jgi:protein-S-isoprenylcysteine O-methyltransferase Ste14
MLLALLVGFVAHRAFYSRKFPPKESDTLVKMPDSPSSNLANIISTVALLSSLVFILFPTLVVWASAPFPIWLRWVGLLVALVGFGLLEWSHRALSANWSDHPRLTDSQVLVQTGPYKRVRHPIYSAFLLILGSTLLITANWLVGLAWLSSVVIDIYARIKFEESIMQKRFGPEYQAYSQRTGKLFPRFRQPAE